MAMYLPVNNSIECTKYFIDETEYSEALKYFCEIIKKMVPCSNLFFNDFTKNIFVSSKYTVPLMKYLFKRRFSNH